MTLDRNAARSWSKERIMMEIQNRRDQIERIKEQLNVDLAGRREIARDDPKVAAEIYPPELFGRYHKSIDMIKEEILFLTQLL